MSKVFDNRISSSNIYVETTFREYLGFAKKIISNNDLQRKRVKTSKTVYSLLKTDLKRGCIMPPLVLAVMKNGAFDVDKLTGTELINYIMGHSDEVLILDGLQRTYTLIDAAAEMENEEQEEYEAFLNYKLRLEVYLEINKFGVLYRMLTLNTGQTPMSPRHQLEMLYGDMLNADVEGIKLIPDVAGSADASKNEFQFKNAIEGFHSYLNRNELPIDRNELLENLKMLENMANEKIEKDLFEDFLSCYIKIFIALRNITEDKTILPEMLADVGIENSPFGTTVYKVFSSSQALTGFGAAIARMKDRGIINTFDDITKDLDSLKPQNDMIWFANLLEKLNNIKLSAKKIGNAQRMFFQYFFRELLNGDSDSYMDLSAAVENGYNKYYSQVS
ncbi:hypothetical protein [Anaerotignum sp.]